MPYALVIVGLILIVSGVRDTHTQLGAQLKADLTGENNFTRYALALFAVGAVGYIDKLRPASTAFMALIIVSLVLSNRGFFQRLNAQIGQGPETVAPGETGGTPALPKLELPKLELPNAGQGTPEGRWFKKIFPGIPDALVPFL